MNKRSQEPRRTLKLYQLFTLLVGTIVGLGWIAASSLWIKGAGPAGALLAFAGGGLVMMILGLCFAEMMTLFPDSGGSVGYAYECFGINAAFATGWLLILSYGATGAFFQLMLGWVLHSLAPSLAGPVIYRAFGADVHLGYATAGILGAAFLTIANYRGAAVAARLQDWLVAVKIGLVLILGICGIFVGKAENLIPLFAGTSSRAAMSGVVAVMATTPFWFAGFDVLPQALRERDQQLDLRRIGSVIVFATIVAFLFYGVVILATSMLLPRQELLHAELPTYTAFMAAFQTPVFANAVLVLGLIGVFSSWNATIFAGARVLQVLSASHVIPPIFRQLSRYGTPGRALLFFVPACTAIGLLGANVMEAVIASTSLTLEFVFIVVCAGLIRLRFTMPNHPRPYRVPGGMVLPVCGVVLAIALMGLTIGDAFDERPFRIPLEWILVGIWSLVGVIAWAAMRRQHALMSAEQRHAILVKPL